MRHIFSVAIALVSSICIAQTLEVKGIPLGATMAAIQARFPEAVCYETACVVDVRKVAQNRCGGLIKSTYACQDTHSEDLYFGPAVTQHYSYRLLNGRVGKITVEFYSQSMSRLVVALTEKYGQPTGQRVDQLQNRMGATIASRVVTWSRPDGTLTIEEHVGRVDDGVVTVQTAEFEQAQRRKFIDGNKAKAKNL